MCCGILDFSAAGRLTSATGAATAMAASLEQGALMTSAKVLGVGYAVVLS
jgi:hypothetical protein